MKDITAISFTHICESLDSVCFHFITLLVVAKTFEYIEVWFLCLLVASFNLFLANDLKVLCDKQE